LGPIDLAHVEPEMCAEYLCQGAQFNCVVMYWQSISGRAGEEHVGGLALSCLTLTPLVPAAVWVLVLAISVGRVVVDSTEPFRTLGLA